MTKQSNVKGEPANNDSDAFLREAIAGLVRQQRKSHEPPLSQEELAHRAGISFEHLNHIENGKATPSIKVLYGIGKALGFRRVSEFLLADDRGLL